MNDDMLFVLCFAISSVLFTIGLYVGVITNNPVWLLLPIAAAPLIVIRRK